MLYLDTAEERLSAQREQLFQDDKRIVKNLALLEQIDTFLGPLGTVNCVNVSLPSRPSVSLTVDAALIEQLRTSALATREQIKSCTEEIYRKYDMEDEYLEL